MRGGTSSRSRHEEILRRWPRLWGEDRDHGQPGELSRPLSRAELAHLHGLARPSRPPRAAPGTVAAAVRSGRPFLAVGQEDGGRRAHVLAGLAEEAADALVADESLLPPAMRRAGEEALRALRAAAEAMLTVIEVPTGRHRTTRPLAARTLRLLGEEDGGTDAVTLVLGHPALTTPACVATVGARALGEPGTRLCAAIGRALAGAGHTVRTGGAPGADAAFAAAALAAGGGVELVLPWAGFADPPPRARAVVADPRRHEGWFTLAARFDGEAHYAGRPPAEAAALAARNAGIMLGGAGLPGRAALCVAVHAGARPSGGTAHALACAAAARVPTLVLRQPEA